MVFWVDRFFHKRFVDGESGVSRRRPDGKCRTVEVSRVAVRSVTVDGWGDRDVCLGEDSSNGAPIHHERLHMDIIDQEWGSKCGVTKDSSKRKASRVEREQHMDAWPGMDWTRTHQVFIQNDERVVERSENGRWEKLGELVD